MSSKLQSDVCFLARVAMSGECLRGEGLVVDWSGGVFASCVPRVQLYVNACNGWSQFALQHHWLLPINCHFLRLYSAAGRGIAAVSSAIEESDLYLLKTISDSKNIGLLCMHCLYQIIVYMLHNGRHATGLHTMIGHAVFSYDRSKTLITTLNRIGVSNSYNAVKKDKRPSHGVYCRCSWRRQSAYLKYIHKN